MRLRSIAAAAALVLATGATDTRADGSYWRIPPFHYNYCAPIFPSPYGLYGTPYGLNFRYGSVWDPAIGDPLPGFYFSLPEPGPHPAAYGPWYTQPGPGFYFYYRRDAY